MSRSTWLLAAFVALALLWSPAIKPAGQAAILLADIYGESLLGADLASMVTPQPRISEGEVRLAGSRMRVTYWRPGWGDRHPAILVVPGASARGNDEPPLRSFGVSLARAGYLAVLPEFAFLKEGRFDPDALAQIAAAHEHVRALAQTSGGAAGAFGVSVGGGLLLAAAGREPAFRDAAFLAVLGAYYDLDTYLASLASRSQLRGGAIVPWAPSQEALDRLPQAAFQLAPTADRAAVSRALEPAPYDEALRRLQALPAGTRAAYDAVSPQTAWAGIRAPIFWIHDPEDAFEPLAEAEQAVAAPRSGQMRLIAPRLVQHAVAESGSARAQGPLVVLGEVLGLLGFAIELLRLGG